MNRREKILAIAVASVIGLFVLIGGYRKLFSGPGRDLDNQIATLAEKNGKLQRENTVYKRSFDKWVSFRKRTYTDDVSRAPVLLTARINELVRRAGLGSLPVTTARPKAVTKSRYDSEISCTVQGQASLERLTNLLYLLSREPQLHRITNLTINPPAKGEREVRFSLRYATLVLKLNSKLPVGYRIPAWAQTQPTDVVLNDVDRARYDVIDKRHLFLPYVPRVARVTPQPEDPPRGDPPRVNPKPPKTANQYDRLQVVGLPSRGGEAEVHLAKDGRDIDEPLKVGDELPIGQIAMVDYRVMPMPDDPDVLSTGRVILKTGAEYWAVELGQTLGQRRILRASELPEELKPKKEPPPAAPPETPADADVTAGAMK